MSSFFWIFALAERMKSSAGGRVEEGSRETYFVGSLLMESNFAVSLCMTSFMRLMLPRFLSISRFLWDRSLLRDSFSLRSSLRLWRSLSVGESMVFTSFSSMNSMRLSRAPTFLVLILLSFFSLLSRINNLLFSSISCLFRCYINSIIFCNSSFFSFTVFCFLYMCLLSRFSFSVSRYLAPSWISRFAAWDSVSDNSNTASLNFMNSFSFPKSNDSPI